MHERGGFQRCTWRSGTRENFWARFALRRVVAAGVPKGQQEPLWLLSRFPGWHHHISVALCCYAFLIAERVRMLASWIRR